MVTKGSKGQRLTKSLHQHQSALKSNLAQPSNSLWHIQSQEEPSCVSPTLSFHCRPLPWDSAVTSAMNDSE